MDIWLTGCTAGLGRALVPKFVEAGHRVVGCGRNEEALTQLRSEFPDHHFAQLDLVDDDAVKRFVAEAAAAFGPPDLVINNAGVINSLAPLWEVSAADFNHVMDVNVNGVANVVRYVVPEMIKAQAGVIVNLSSGWGRSTAPGVAPYCASKWAIEGLTAALAQDLPPGIGAVAVSPGIVATDMLKVAWPDSWQQFPEPTEWAVRAAPFFLGLSASDNGASLTAP